MPYTGEISCTHLLPQLRTTQIATSICNWILLALTTGICCSLVIEGNFFYIWSFYTPNLDFCTTALPNAPVMNGATAVTIILVEHVAEILLLLSLVLVSEEKVGEILV